MELQLERVLLSGENLSETDPQASQWGWIVPKHGECHPSVLRETGPFGIMPHWPDRRKGGTVPPLVIGICPNCEQEFIGLGPL